VSVVIGHNLNYVNDSLLTNQTRSTLRCPSARTTLWVQLHNSESPSW